MEHFKPRLSTATELLMETRKEARFHLETFCDLAQAWQPNAVERVLGKAFAAREKLL